jgi:ATP-dependent DNA ligase
MRRKRAIDRLIWATSTVLSQGFSIEERSQGLFAAAERLDLEGMVAKRKADRSAPEALWYKVKNRAYTQAEGRVELFQKRRGGI